LDGRCVRAIIWFDKIVIGGATRLGGRTLSTVDKSGWVGRCGVSIYETKLRKSEGTISELRKKIDELERN